MDNLLTTIRKYFDAEKDYKDCCNSCEYDSGYFCSERRELMDDLYREFETELKGIILETVKQKAQSND